ncbi:NHLP leader peptide family RiPP precursor [Nostoc sp. CHAB 5834]|nr:NHLP leader peptide family RiPP precursor [Nostoc sp. CHAB 5834]
MIVPVEHQTKASELIKTLAQKAWESSTFKEQLVKNPVATIQEVVGEGFTVPQGKRIVVEDQMDESKIYLNIPAKPDFDEFELTDEQLEVVAGGETLVVGIVCGIALCWAVDKLF